MMVSAPLQNNMTRSSGVRTKEKQSHHAGLLFKNLFRFSELPLEAENWKKNNPSVGSMSSMEDSDAEKYSVVLFCVVRRVSQLSEAGAWNLFWSSGWSGTHDPFSFSLSFN